MKTQSFYLALMTVIALMTSCGNDENQPQTAPTVITNENIVVTTTSAIVSGEVTDDGNSSINEAGFVYSSIVEEPTTADNKVTVLDVDEFVYEISGLTSGTIYNVRAYAINKKGTSYGEKRTFETGNLPPVATNVQVTGVLEVNKDVTATFTYTDPEGNLQGASTYQWYMANEGGTGEVQIAGATNATFHIGEAQSDKVLRVKVVPVAQTGTLTGVEVSSGFTTVVGAETVTFTYNNVQVTYGTIIGPSGKKWLDRNLGANRLAESIDDYQAYGDLFQWGRFSDGHQKVTRSGPNDADVSGVTGITSTTAPYELSPDDTPDTDKFIIRGGFSGNGDWRNPQNNQLWQGLSGANNPCPAGWRIPTSEEYIAEGLAGPGEAFTKLRFTYTGQRDRRNGTFASSTGGLYWTSTVAELATAGQWGSVQFSFTDTAIDAPSTKSRAAGQACRCIKD